MREAQFLKQNAERWKAFEKKISDSNSNADDLAELYVQVTDDLAYAKTFYPLGKSTAYLNSVAVKVYSLLYRNKKERSNRLITFWKYELPYTVYQCRKQILFSLVCFLLSVGIGLISSANDDRFVRLILPDGYLNMTERNIREGHPLDVYGSEESTTMFYFIALHNISISFYYDFLQGIIFGVPPLRSLILNGIMVGCFQYIFYKHHVLGTSLLTIWIHGTLEITAIIVSGAAGFAFAVGLLFPRSYSRGKSLMMGAKKGLKLIVGMVPFYLVAAIFESFATRHYQSFEWYGLIFIIPSLVFVVWYLILYPIKIYRKRFELNLETAE